MPNDKAILVSALEVAVGAFRKANPNPSLLGSHPDRAVLDPLSNAIARCATYQAVAGLVVFCGGSGPVLDSRSLASHLFSKGGWPTHDVEGAVDWLLRLLSTREATVLVKAAIWGLSVDQSVSLGPSAQLMPFASLPDSYMKGRLEERAKPCYDGSAWIAPTYYDMPDAAYVEEVAKFPFIRSDGAAFQKMNDVEEGLNDVAVILQGAALGQPIAVACWFEYLDHDLEYSEWESAFSWLLPEVHPRVHRGPVVEGGRLQASITAFEALAPKRRDILLRSMERFRLSQCRRQPIDRVLDLALAFEIAVSDDGGEQIPPGWKVSVRTAQLIGGRLSERQANRKSISDLYKLRNRATHGGHLKGKGVPDPDLVIPASGDVYLKLMTKLVAVRVEPDWKTIELDGSS